MLQKRDRSLRWNPPDQTSIRLSSQERVALCNDIHRFSLLLGRDARSEAGGIGAAVTPSPALRSPLERLQLIAALRPRLEATLHAISACPDEAAVPEPRSLPLPAVRGNPATLARLSRRPADYRAWVQASTRPADVEEAARVQEHRAAHTVQTPPNRIAACFLAELAHETRALHRLALFCNETTAAVTAEKLFHGARRWLRQSPFRECVSGAKHDRPLSPEPLLRGSPAYRSLYAILRATRSGLHLDWSESAILRFPVLEAWHLYEIWCFLHVGAALCRLGWRPVETDCLQVVQTGMRLRLAHGQASRIRFRAPQAPILSFGAEDTLNLFYQPLFASANQASRSPVTGFRSLSHVMQPDMALERNGRLLLLDPKYRPYRDAGDEQEDVDKMHAYRDAIVRTDGTTGRTLSAVDAAWCLFPGMPDAATSLPQRLRAYPASTPVQLFGTAGVGAVQVRPGADNRELVDLINYWLNAGNGLNTVKEAMQE